MEKQNHLPATGGPKFSTRLMAGFGLLACAIGLALLLVARPKSPSPEPISHATPPPGTWFENVAPACGIDFVHDSGTGEKKYMPEIMSGGVCLLDYDRDGFLDVYFVQGGRVLGATADTPGNRLFHNLGNARFEDVTPLTHVGDTGFGMGCAVGDINHDGWPDLYVTNAGPNVLYINTGAEGKPGFRDITESAGVGHSGFSASAAFLDFNQDGLLDLFVVNYVRWSPEKEIECSGPSGQVDYCTPNAYKGPAPDVLYRNNGDGTFTDVTRAAGLSAIFGNGLGVVCADFDDDGHLDIAVANDLQANQLWINKGDGRFRERGLEQGIAYNESGMAESGMGIDAQDVDGDGDLDLLMTHFEGQTDTLYVNENGYFEDRTSRMGLGSSLPFTGFGTAIVDLNHDGVLDIYVANGRVTLPEGNTGYADPYVDENQLFEGLPEGGFREVFPRGGQVAAPPLSSRGAAFGDYDNDGDIDIFVNNRDGPARVLRNIAASGGHWIGFRVLDDSGVDAVGARVEITFKDTKRIRDVRRAYSYCSANDPRVHFGLGAVDKIDRATVHWLEGSTQSFGPFEVDRYHTLKQEGNKAMRQRGNEATRQ